MLGNFEKVLGKSNTLRKKYKQIMNGKETHLIPVSDKETIKSFIRQYFDHQLTLHDRMEF
jgi:hypothetical protein